MEKEKWWNITRKLSDSRERSLADVQVEKSDD